MAVRGARQLKAELAGLEAQMAVYLRLGYGKAKCLQGRGAREVVLYGC
jgi:hypothetical protein